MKGPSAWHLRFGEYDKDQLLSFGLDCRAELTDHSHKSSTTFAAVGCAAFYNPIMELSEKDRRDRKIVNDAVARYVWPGDENKSSFR